MFISCSHCAAVLVMKSGACRSCGAPITAEQQRALTEQAGRRRSRLLMLIALVAVLVLGGGGGVGWHLFGPRPFVPIVESRDPAAALIAVEKVYEEPYLDYDRKPSRHVGVVVVNRGENLIECVVLGLRVFDGKGVQRRATREDFGCRNDGDPLWPGDRAAGVFDVLELDEGERYDIVVEKLKVGAPAVGAAPQAQLSVSVEKEVGLTDLGPFLRHSVRADSFRPHVNGGFQELAFQVTAEGEREVTGLAYALRVFDAAGAKLGVGYVTAASRGDQYRPLPSLKPGESRTLSVSAQLERPAPEGVRWELVVNRFSAVRPPH